MNKENETSKQPESPLALNSVVSGSKNLCGWISVKDRLPKKGEPVVVNIFNGSPTTAYIAKGKWYVSANLIGAAKNFSIEDREITFQITHWMPLPEPCAGG